jgi:hypothetical protein
MNKIAKVKAQSKANISFNGSTISTDLVIKTTKCKSVDKPCRAVETKKSIKENAMVFAKKLRTSSTLITQLVNEYFLFFIRK